MAGLGIIFIEAHPTEETSTNIEWNFNAVAGTPLMIATLRNRSTQQKSLHRTTRLIGIAQLSLMCLCGGTGIVSAWVQSSALERQTAAAALLGNHDMADMMHDAIRGDALAAIQASNPRSGLKRDDIMQDFNDHLKELRARISTDAEYRGMDEVGAATAKLAAPMEAYAMMATDIVQLSETDPASATQKLPVFFDRFRDLETSMASAADAISGAAQQTTDWARLVGRVAIVLLLLILAMCVAAIHFFVRATTRNVNHPIEQLAGAMRQLGDGNLQVEVAGTDREDELGDMAKAMVAFRDQLVDAEAAKQAQAQLIVDSLGSGLRSLADGDLTAEVTDDLQSPFSGLKHHFNSAVTSLRTLIGSVSESAASIRSGSAEIAHASEDLARRTEANAANLEQTSAAIAKMDERLRATAIAAGRTVGRADDAMVTVASGRSITDEAVQAMTRVSESAKGIDSVIEGLDKIAFQTRVLAMNAAVEAGRAGDAGRGFAVVADLVSALAMRAEDEAGRARDQLTATQADIGTAVERVQRVDGALSGISSDVGEVHKLLADIAVDNQAQATDITQVSAAVNAMDKATQQNAAMVEETSAAARKLTSEVTALSQQAARFDIGQASISRTSSGQSYQQPPRASAAARPAPTNTYRPRSTPTPAPAPAPARAAPVMAGATGDSDDWTSF